MNKPGQTPGKVPGRDATRDASRDGKIETRLAKLRILDKEVTIACKPGEEDDLKQAAAYIDSSMRDLKSRNTTSSIEKIAIVTAINTADALLKSRARQADDSTALPRIAAINARLSSLLEASTEARVERSPMNVDDARRTRDKLDLADERSSDDEDTPVLSGRRSRHAHDEH